MFWNSKTKSAQQNLLEKLEEASYQPLLWAACKSSEDNLPNLTMGDNIQIRSDGLIFVKEPICWMRITITPRQQKAAVICYNRIIAEKGARQIEKALDG